VFQELRAANDLHDLGYSFHFWRTATGREVDFVLHGDRGLHAIEVKHAAKVGPADLSGLQAFLRDYPESRVWLLYVGDRPEQHGDVTVLPVADALPRLAALLGPTTEAPQPPSATR
jgi:predicted AAA+ superfamily ATPase